MSLKSPVTTEDFFRAVGPAFALAENARQQRDRPRASSIAADAREQAYYMADVEPDTEAEATVAGCERTLDAGYTQEQGRVMEDLSFRLLQQNGIWVVDRQLALPSDYPVTGHPDGRIDGTTMGVEHKHLGRYAYLDILKHGLDKGAPEYILQAALYGHALGWESAFFVITSQDASSIRTEMTMNRRAKNPANRWVDAHPWQNPKAMFFVRDLRPLYDTLVPQALARAQWLSEWKAQSGEPTDVRLEADPYRGRGDRVAFPWSYSEYLARAQRDGQRGVEAPPLPWTGRYSGN